MGHCIEEQGHVVLQKSIQPNVKIYYLRIRMNWIAIKEEDNTYSLRNQTFLSLFDCCIASLATSIKGSYARHLDAENTETFTDDVLTQIVNYFHSNLLKPEPDTPILPHWISDNLLALFLHDELVPNEFFNRVFSTGFCSLSKVHFKYFNKPLSDRLSHVCSFNLTSLNLSNCHSITDEFIVPFSISSRKTAEILKILKLRNCGINQISSLKLFSNLTHLDISENNLSFGNVSPLAVLHSVVESFPLLKSLDLHRTKLVASFYDRDVDSLLEMHNLFLKELHTKLRLEELILYTLAPIQENFCHFFQLKLFYSALSEFTSLTHLDLSGWPALDTTPEITISNMSKGLVFFGLYDTPLTQQNTNLSLHCSEIAGFANEHQILSTVQRYWSDRHYMHNIYCDLSDPDLQISFSGDTTLRMIPCVLDSLDIELEILAKKNVAGILNNCIKLGLITASLHFMHRRCYLPEMVTRVIRSCIVLFHGIDVENILREDWTNLAGNTCSLFFTFIADENAIIQNSMNLILI